MTATATRTPTWINVGTDIRKATSVEEALHISGLDYTVEKVPVYLEGGIEIPGAFCTKREGSDTTYGVVGSQFEIVQNSEGFDFVNNMVSEGLKFLKAGENGKFVYIIAELPPIDLLGDKVTPHVIFQNSHSGNTTLKATIAPLRIICQNQFNMTFKKASNKISLRHTKSIKGRMHTAQEVLIGSSEYLTELQKQAALMASRKVSQKQVAALVDSLFEVKPEFNPSQLRRIEEKRDRFLAAYNTEDNQNFIGTQWGLVNAYTDFVTHKPLTKETQQAQENYFIKATLKGSIAEVVDRIAAL